MTKNNYAEFATKMSISLKLLNMWAIAEEKLIWKNNWPRIFKEGSL